MFKKLGVQNVKGAMTCCSAAATRHWCHSAAACFLAAAAHFTSYTSLKVFKESMEKEFLIAKLKQLGGNISKTAEAIDTPRSNLYKKLEQYAINVEELMGK